MLFASVDPAVAAARGVPVRAVGLIFLALLGATAAEATQAVGALLLLGLVAAPAGASQRLTPNPYLGLGLSSQHDISSSQLGHQCVRTLHSRARALRAREHRP